MYISFIVALTIERAFCVAVLNIVLHALLAIIYVFEHLNITGFVSSVSFSVSPRYWE